MGNLGTEAMIVNIPIVYVLIVLPSYIHFIVRDKMKAILAIAVISCFFIVTHSQNLQCVTRLANLGTCITRLATATQGSTDFCNECGNSLVSYYQDCAGGAGVEQVQTGKFNFLNLNVIQ